MLEDRTKSLAAVQAKELAKERKKTKRYAAFSAGYNILSLVAYCFFSIPDI